jgi:hypothetical protein
MHHRKGGKSGREEREEKSTSSPGPHEVFRIGLGTKSSIANKKQNPWSPQPNG